MNLCFLCQQRFALWQIHSTKCKNASQILHQTPKFVYVSDKVFCKDCHSSLPKVDKQIQYHRKNCRKKLKKLSRTKSSCDKISVSHSHNTSWITKTNSIFQDNSNKNEEKKHFKKIGEGLIDIFVEKWIDEKGFIHPRYLVNIFFTRLQEALSGLYDIGQNFNMESLKKYHFITDVIEKAEDIFKVQQNTAIIEKLPIKQNQKNEIFSIFNKILSQFNFKQKYVIKRSQSLQKVRDYVLYKDLIRLVIQLFKTKEENMIHIALDLLIIFHSGERFPSSIQKIKQAILYMKKQNKTAFKLTATKTGKQTLIFMSSQLIKLLKKFKWQNFLLDFSGMKNVKRKMNFSLIALRRGMYIQGVNHNREHLDPSLFTGHRVKRTAEIYVNDLLDKYKHEFHKNLTIPLTQQQFNNIKTFSLPNKIIPKIFDKAFIKTQKINWEEYPIDTNVQGSEDKLLYDLTQDEQDEEHESEEIHIDPVSLDVQTNLLSTQIKSTTQVLEKQFYFQDEFEYFKVEQMILIRKNLLFNFAQSFVSDSKGYSCIFCQQVYSQIPINFCNCFLFHTGSSIKVSNKTQIHELQLQMPTKYFENQVLFQQIRYLIHRRGFYMSNVALMQDPITITAPKQIKSIKLKDYKNYMLGNYFPPIIPCLSGQEMNGFSGVGMVAVQHIQQNVFLGEYGGDIIPLKKTILLKRKDMSMTLYQDYQISAFHHLSYVQLVNSSKSKANCKSLRCVIDGELKIILYSSKKIIAGSQLLYDYAGEFRTKYDAKLSSTIDIFQKIKFVQIPNGCFANALEYILQQIYLQIPEILNKRKCLIEFYQNKDFQPYSQQDFREYFEFLVSKLENSKQKNYFHYIKSIKLFDCQKCFRSWEKEEKNISILLGVDDPNFLFEKEIYNDYKCLNCSQISVKIIEKVTQFPDIFFVFVQQLNPISGKKINGQANYKNVFTFGSNMYRAQYKILFFGQNNAGHYMVKDLHKNCIINDGKVETSRNSKFQNEYAIIFIRTTEQSFNASTQKIIPEQSIDKVQKQEEKNNASTQKIIPEQPQKQTHEVQLKQCERNLKQSSIDKVQKQEEKNYASKQKIIPEQEEKNQCSEIMTKKKHSFDVFSKFENETKKKKKRQKQVSKQTGKWSKFMTPIIENPNIQFPQDTFESGVLILDEKGNIVMQRNSNKPFFIASIIKILVLLAVDQLKKQFQPHEIQIPIYNFGTVTEPSLAGQYLQIQEALQLLMTISANDVAMGFYNHFLKKNINLIQKIKQIALQLDLKTLYIQGCVGVQRNLASCQDVATLFKEIQKRKLQEYFKKIVSVNLKKKVMNFEANFRPPFPIKYFKTGTFMNKKQSIVFKSMKGHTVVLLNHKDRTSEMNSIRNLIQ